MTKMQATKEALRRWGKYGFVQHIKTPDKDRAYRVGHIVLAGLCFHIKGMGRSWEKAFAAVRDK